MTVGVSPGEKREKKKVLSSLSKLNSNSNSLWQPLLFQDLLLQTKHLDCFFHAMKRVPNIGTFVQNLRFTQYFKGKVEWEKQGGGWSATITKFSTELITRTSQSLQPFDDLIFASKDSRKFFSKHQPSSLQFHRHRCAHARGLILDSALHLKSFAFDQASEFPFCKRVGKSKDAVLLSGLFSNLKQIDVAPIVFGDSYFNAVNSMFILTSLPHLRKALLSLKVVESDVDFFKEHKSVFMKGRSKVKELTLVLRFTENVRSLGEICRGLTNVTTLTELILVTDQDKEVTLQGLKNSFTSLTSLKVQGCFFNLPNDLPRLALLINVTSLAGDARFVLLFANHLHEKTGFVKVEVLPSNLKAWKLTSNTLPEGDPVLQNVENDRNPFLLFPEGSLAWILNKVVLPSTFSQIFSYRKFMRDEDRLIIAEERIFDDAREFLIRECSKYKIQLTLLDEDDDVFHGRSESRWDSSLIFL